MGEINETKAKARARIVKHMNTDHGDSLSRYLEFYNRLPKKMTAEARIEELRSEYMIIESRSSRNLIPIDPPLAEDWSDARTRFTQMDRAALTGLGRSDLVITRYVPPTGFHLVVFLACVATYVAFCRRANFSPDSFFVYRLLGLHHLPWLARFCYSIQPLLFPFMIVLHIAEATWLHVVRLSPFGVETGSRLWFTWILSIAVEGVGAKIRFDRLVEQQRRRRGDGTEK